MIVDATQKPIGETLPINRGDLSDLLNKIWRILKCQNVLSLKTTFVNLQKRKMLRYLRLQFTDILGTIKNVEVPVSQLEKST